MEGWVTTSNCVVFAQLYRLRPTYQERVDRSPGEGEKDLNCFRRCHLCKRILVPRWRWIPKDICIQYSTSLTHHITHPSSKLNCPSEPSSLPFLYIHHFFNHWYPLVHNPPLSFHCTLLSVLDIITTTLFRHHLSRSEADSLRFFPPPSSLCLGNST